MTIASQKEKEKLQKRLKEGTDNSNGYGSSWDPDQGDILIGRLQDIVTVSTRFGDREVARIQTEEGLVSLWLTHKVLIDEWQEKSPGVSDLIGVIYLGKKKSKNGQYCDYNLEVISESGESESNKQALDEEPATDEVPF